MEFIVKVDEDAELIRLQKIEAVRQRQQAAMDAAAAKYREEKRLKEIEAAKKKEEEWERHQQGLGYRSKTKKTVNLNKFVNCNSKNENYDIV